MAGPYYFAWADEGEAFAESVHAIEDDDIFEFDLQHNEGDFPSLAITVKNPRVGLLAPGRKIWAWFSWDNGTEIVPLFFGRLIGLPEQIQKEEVVLNFIARPSDYATQKSSVAESLRVQPFWDGIWFNSQTRDDSDNVLESRSAFWHIDRITLDVTISDMLNGEDGTLAFDETNTFYDSLRQTYTQNALRAVQMTAQVSWHQQGEGSFAIDRIQGYPSPIYSYTGEGLANAWPRKGTNIGGGWYWADASAKASGLVDSAIVGEIVYHGVIGIPGTTSTYPDGGFDTRLGIWGYDGYNEPIGWSYHVAIPNVRIDWVLNLGWKANRRKTETLSFTLKADVQDMLTMPTDGEVLALSMNSSEVSEAIDDAGSSGGVTSPLRTQTARGYFNTTRGQQSLEYLLAVARAHLVARSRAVNITFEIPFELAVQSDLSCRKNATLVDPRLPGSPVGGKIIAYKFAFQNGQQKASITIGCAIGKGGSVIEVPGNPDYVEDGYVEDGYQTFTGKYTVLGTVSDVSYLDQQNVVPNDDGLELRHLTKHSIKSLKIINGNGSDETQEDALDRFDVTISDSGQGTAKNTTYAQVEITLPSLEGGPFETLYEVDVSDLVIPMGIDLEAST